VDIVNRYYVEGRDGVKTLDSIRDKLKELSFYREFTLSQISGGRSGDLG
jgi:hypothetical protein